MEDDYIFIEEGGKGCFIKKGIITSITYDRTGEEQTAIITTSELEATEHGTQQRRYTVRGVMAVYALHDHFYQRSRLKLWNDKS